MTEHQEIVDINKYRGKRRAAGWKRRSLVVVFLLACVFAGYFFACSSFFDVSEIIVSGSKNSDADSLRRLCGFEVGGSMFLLKPSDSEYLLSIDPWVKSVTVKRRLPGKIVISIVERTPCAIISLDNYVMEVDIEGRVLSRSTTVRNAELPLISGIALEKGAIIPGTYIYGTNMQAALAIIASLPADAADIGEINVANKQDIRLYLLNGMEIRLGNSSSFAEKYITYNGILNDIKQGKQSKVGYIDVSSYDRPVTGN